MVLTMARAIGEYGAVSVVSSGILGATESLTMFVDSQYTANDYRSGLCGLSRIGADRDFHIACIKLGSKAGLERRMTISAVGISKRFKNFQALDNVTINIADGELTSILGPSGSGKSTLLRVIAGLEQPDQGRVHIGGVDMTGRPPQRRGVGFVFQHYAAFKHMTVRENVAFGLKVRRKPRKVIRARVDELLELVQLSGFSDRYPGQLSGRSAAAMGLARALAVEPEVMLLDEPFGALDARVRHELRAWLRRLHDEVHVTTILVTHDQEEAMEISDTVIVMDHGRVEQTGSPKELYDRPVNEFVMGFLGYANRIGDAMVRPHDVAISLEPGANRVSGVVKRIVFLGFEVRAEVELESKELVRVQLTRTEADGLGIIEGQTVFLNVKAGQRFAEPRQAEAESKAERDMATV